jgi:hypothetical protein
VSRVVSIRIDERLYQSLARHADGRGLKTTVAARDLIRRGLGVVKSEYDAGFAEGKIDGKREILTRINEET